MKLTDLQEKWLQELESGNYQQTNKCLFDGIGYCCLGLAEKVCFNRKFEFYSDKSGVKDKYWIDIFWAVMSDVDASDLGLNDHIGRIYGFVDEFYAALVESGFSGGQTYSLASYNDSGATFKQIAFAIRKVPQSVFKSK